MSLNKAIEHGKEHRKPYRGSKAIDPTCRNHGTCDWCKENRLHKSRDKHPAIEEDYMLAQCNQPSTGLCGQTDGSGHEKDAS